MGQEEQIWGGDIRYKVGHQKWIREIRYVMGISDMARGDQIWDGEVRYGAGRSDMGQWRSKKGQGDQIWDGVIRYGMGKSDMEQGDQI